MRYRAIPTTLALAGLLLLPLAGSIQAGRKGEPDKVVVQHILISFGNKARGQVIDRKKRDAKALAMTLLERAESGEDFDALVDEYTNDKPPGIFLLVNTDVPKPGGARARADMVSCFGDVSFKLEVGEVGLAKYYPELCPFGYHVIKRLE